MIRMRAARWAIAGVGGALVVVSIIASAGSRTAALRALLIETLSERMDSDIALEYFTVDTFPTVHITGTGLIIRHKGRTDVPPLVAIDSFTIEGGMYGLLSRPRHFRTITLTGLKLNIPPGFKRQASSDGSADAGKPAEGAKTADVAPAASPPVDKKKGRDVAAITIEHLVADNVVLSLIPRRAGKKPRVFAVHRLTLDKLGYGEPMDFEAAITNPMPKGLILTKGKFGPWQKTEPGETVLAGSYLFNDVDLTTVKGIGGHLKSQGMFAGMLGRIDVSGETHTPDFRVNVAGNPIPLDTRFKAVVDGTDGDTYLTSVSAHFLKTSLMAEGTNVGEEGVKGRHIKVHVKITDGRIEDVLRMAVKGERPVLTGKLALHADMNLPAGHVDVMDRVDLAGEFDMAGARFTDREVQLKLAEMSQRASEDDMDPQRSVRSSLRGRFKLANGRLSLPDATFGIPGAKIRVAGTYGLDSEILEFDGTLRTDAALSKLAGGGVKGALLKVVNPLFRKDGAGAVLPIKIRGTRAVPKIGLDVGKALGKG